jgi:beta-galactosidase
MVRLWSWEAIAHEAEAVCYFRWRQAPFAQEQMHAGLLRPDGADAPAMEEARAVANELAKLGSIEHAQARVALVFDYESCWAWQTQPQGASFDNFSLALAMYRGLRRLGLSIDILAPNTKSLEDYKVVLIPGLMTWNEQLLAALEEFKGVALIGPRSGSKTRDFSIPDTLPPALGMLDCKVAYVESLRDAATRPLTQGGYFHRWVEALESNLPAIETFTDGSPALVGNHHLQYLAGWPDESSLERILKRILVAADVAYQPMPEGVRQRVTGSHQFVFNYNADDVEFNGQVLPPAGVRIEAL